MLIPFKSTIPQIGNDTKVFPNATILGNVTIGERCSVWPGAVIRSDRDGDVDPVIIGDDTNIQDNVSVHVSFGYGVQIGSRTTVGHGAIIHGCSIGDETLIGMGAIIQNGAQIGSNCLIGSGAMVKSGTVVPDGHVAYGFPAKVVRPLTEAELELYSKSYRNYQGFVEGYEEAERSSKWTEEAQP